MKYKVGDVVDYQRIDNGRWVPGVIHAWVPAGKHWVIRLDNQSDDDTEFYATEVYGTDHGDWLRHTNVLDLIVRALKLNDE